MTVRDIPHGFGDARLGDFLEISYRLPASSVTKIMMPVCEVEAFVECTEADSGQIVSIATPSQRIITRKFTKHVLTGDKSNPIRPERVTKEVKVVNWVPSPELLKKYCPK